MRCTPSSIRSIEEDRVGLRVLIIFVLALPASAAWQRHVLTPKDDWVDTPAPHPLSYFIDDPGARCEQRDFCLNCSREERPAESRKIKAELSLVGNLAGFAIYDLYYHFEADRRTDTKLILVKTGADEYREIYQCTPSTLIGAGAVRSVLVKIGNDRFLEAKYDTSRGRTNLVDGSRAADYYDYFWFDKTGAALVDFRPILRAVKSVLPKGVVVPSIDSDLAAPGVDWLWHFGDPLVCRLNVQDGTTVINFRFNRQHVVVVKALYKRGRS